jgi:hypothetical protein
MQEIANRSCRNAFATIIMYAISIFFSKGGFILPFPVYEVLFFILACYLFIKANQIKVDLSFFIFVLIISIVWLSTSVFSLQMILPHQWLDSLVTYFPVIDLIIVLLFGLVTFLKYRNYLVKYKSVYFLFAFMIISKWGMLILN